MPSTRVPTGSLSHEFLSWRKAGFSLRAACILAQDITSAVASGADRQIARAIGLDHLRRLGLWPVPPPPAARPPAPAVSASVPPPVTPARRRGYKPLPPDFCPFPQRRFVTGFLTHIEQIPTRPLEERPRAAALLSTLDDDDAPTEQYPAIVAALHGGMR